MPQMLRFICMCMPNLWQSDVTLCSVLAGVNDYYHDYYYYYYYYY